MFSERLKTFKHSIIYFNKSYITICIEWVNSNNYLYLTLIVVNINFPALDQLILWINSENFNKLHAFRLV